MRNLPIFALAMFAAAAVTNIGAAGAETAATWTGLYVSTPFPSQSIGPGNPVTLDIEVHNAGLPPEAVDLSLPEVATGWKAELLGGGHPINSVFVGPNDQRRVSLRLTPPKGAKAGGYDFRLAAKGMHGNSSLPIHIVVGDVVPTKLSISTDLPALRGTPHSNFTYKLTIHNPGTHDVTVQLQADAPPGFQTTFKQQYGSQELTSVPIKAGGKRDLSIKIQPPGRVDAGNYKVAVHAIAGDDNATTDLTMDITGQPDLKLSGADGRLSGEAKIGDQTSFDLTLANNGSAPARDVKLTSSAPSGWKVEFKPDRLDSIAPGAQGTVKALVTPSTQAIAGDYQLTLRASSPAASDSADFRITARTSTMWGVVGILIIAAALGVLVLAVARYGRR